MASVNGLHNSEKRNKIFNFLKTKKIDRALLKETHSTVISELTWQKEWKGLSFWNSRSIHQTAGVAILFCEKSEGKIQNIERDGTGRIISISFTLGKQNLHVVNLYGPNKPYQREIFFQILNTYITSNQNTKDRVGGNICNTHLNGSTSLNQIVNTQKFFDTWRKKTLQLSIFLS